MVIKPGKALDMFIHAYIQAYQVYHLCFFSSEDFTYLPRVLSIPIQISSRRNYLGREYRQIQNSVKEKSSFFGQK
jgi:hypothetical protein